MLQSLLSLMLAAVQVLAWNAAPVYLCLEADGSACVDRGPAFCDCCQGGEQLAGHGCGRSGCENTTCADHDEPAGGELTLNEAPCGCEHEQISDSLAAVKTQQRTSNELAAHPLFAATVPNVVIGSPASGQWADALLESSSSSALAARAGVVLRL